MASRILVCNFSRFGDLLQTQPLLSALSKSGHETSLLCLEAFRPVVDLMADVGKVYALPERKLSSAMSANWVQASAQLLEFCADLVSDLKPHWLINLTPTPPARLLIKLLADRGAKVLGFGMDQYGFGLNQGLWASFIAMTARNRHYAPFNLADMFRRVGGSLAFKMAKDPCLKNPDQNAMEWAANFIAANLPSGTEARNFVCFQLGASAERRRWPVGHFAELGRKLWKESGTVPILLGTSQEAGLGEEYARIAKHPFINAIGRSTLPNLAALLTSSSLLVTNDTGTMHLAAGLKVPVLAFFLATARPWDTGPALVGSCCLEPRILCHPCDFSDICMNNHQCGSSISPQTVFSLVQAWLEHGEWTKGVTTQTAAECKVWVTAKDKKGFYTLLPSGGQESDLDSQWLLLLRDYWSQLLDALESGKFIADPAASPLIKFDTPVKTLTEAAHIMKLLIKQSSLLTANAKGRALFLKNCERLQNLLDISPPLAALGAFWREFQLNQGADLKYFIASLPIFVKSFEWLKSRLAV